MRKLTQKPVVSPVLQVSPRAGASPRLEVASAPPPVAAAKPAPPAKGKGKAAPAKEVSVPTKEVPVPTKEVAAKEVKGKKGAKPVVVEKPAEKTVVVEKPVEKPAEKPGRKGKAAKAEAEKPVAVEKTVKSDAVPKTKRLFTVLDSSTDRVGGHYWSNNPLDAAHKAARRVFPDDSAETVDVSIVELTRGQPPPTVAHMYSITRKLRDVPKVVLRDGNQIVYKHTTTVRANGTKPYVRQRRSKAAKAASE